MVTLIFKGGPADGCEDEVPMIMLLAAEIVVVEESEIYELEPFDREDSEIVAVYSCRN